SPAAVAPALGNELSGRSISPRPTNRRIPVLDLDITAGMTAESGAGGGSDLIPMDLPSPDQLEPAAKNRAEPSRSQPAMGRDAFLTAASATPADKDRIHALLKELVTQGGSDLHVTAGKPPFIRQNGELVMLEGPILTAQQL